MITRTYHKVWGFPPKYQEATDIAKYGTENEYKLQFKIQQKVNFWDGHIREHKKAYLKNREASIYQALTGNMHHRCAKAKFMLEGFKLARDFYEGQRQADET
jgi:hypothetical protein